jgi:uncharacterized protein (TIGR03067 family)
MAEEPTMAWQMTLAVLLSLPGGADDAAGEAAKKEMAKFAGYWDVVSVERNGAKAQPKDNDYTRLVFTGDKVTANKGSREAADKKSLVTHEARYKLDPAARTIEVRFFTGPDQEKTLYGTYQLEGDSLKICWTENKEKRPTELSTKPGSDATLLVLKRGKP